MPWTYDGVMFDRAYPVENGIVDALPEEMRFAVAPSDLMKSFKDVQDEMEAAGMKVGKHFEQPMKKGMANLQRVFYDKMARAFQEMDDADRRSGGLFWWKIYRIVKYDHELMSAAPGRKMLFIGAGNCRLGKLFAELGWQVTCTDISREMLKVGRERAGSVHMRYVAHNAEERFPFLDDQWDVVYSLCVMNHIVDWKNYIREKLRCLKPDGILVERMPNVRLWSFWRQQGDLYKGIEYRALECHRKNAEKAFVSRWEGDAEVWTHDRQVRIAYAKVPRILSRWLYLLRTRIEDRKNIDDLKDDNGIYTMVRAVKTVTMITGHGVKGNDNGN